MNDARWASLPAPDGSEQFKHGYECGRDDAPALAARAAAPVEDPVCVCGAELSCHPSDHAFVDATHHFADSDHPGGCNPWCNKDGHWVAAAPVEAGLAERVAALADEWEAIDTNGMTLSPHRQGGSQ